MKRDLFFSVVIPTYNRLSDLRRAIDSVLRQPYGNFEIVVSDNQSTDGTRSYVTSISNNRVRYFSTPHHVPVQRNIQYAISKASGTYVVLLGDDDIFISTDLLAKLAHVLYKKKYGVVRLNYVSLAPDKRSVFDFRASKHFLHDSELYPNENSFDVIQFIEGMDPSFMSGLVFINSLPKNIKVLQSELNCWFPLLYWSAKKYGAFYLSSPSILASWSHWRPVKNQTNPLYSLVDGKLSGERFYEEVKKHLDKEEYAHFLERKVFGTYVLMFPAVKYFTGSDNLIQLARRIMCLVPKARWSFIFWSYLFFSMAIPVGILGFFRALVLKDRIYRMKVKTKEVTEGFEYYKSI